MRHEAARSQRFGGCSGESERSLSIRNTPPPQRTPYCFLHLTVSSEPSEPMLPPTGVDGSFTRTTTVKFDEDRSSTAGGSILAGVDAARSRSPPVAEAGSNGLSPNVGALPAASGSAANQETSSERNSSFLGGSGSLLSELGALLTPKSPAKQNLSPTLSPRSRDDMRELLNGIAQNLAAQQQQISELVERLDAESSQHSC